MEKENTDSTFHGHNNNAHHEHVTHKTQNHTPTHTTHYTAEKKQEHKAARTMKPTVWKNATFVLAILLVISLFANYDLDVNLTRGSSEETIAAVAAPAGAAVAAPPSALDVSSTYGPDDHIKGDPNAPVTIVEFSDFECPFCERFYSQTYDQIVDQYVDTGKVKFIYRDFPLSFHAQAQKAAEAAECAGEQDKFFEMHDLLFERGVAGGIASFKSMAASLSLDTTEFNTCLDSGAMASEVQEDFSDGQRLGIQGTPGFLINGQLVSGAQPFSVFQQAIEAQLN